MGFFEILLIIIVTLVVIGPAKIPETVRSIAITIGRLKRSINRAFYEVEQQMGLEQVRDQLSQESIVQNIHKINCEVSSLDRKIFLGEEAMPWTAEEYEALQRAKK